MSGWYENYFYDWFEQWFGQWNVVNSNITTNVIAVINCNRIKKNNYKEIVFAIVNAETKGKSTSFVTSTTDIIFQIKNDPAGPALITKNLVSGVYKNDPSDSYVRVVIDTTDWDNVDIDSFAYIGIKLVISNSEQIEPDIIYDNAFIDTIEIEQNIIT